MKRREQERVNIYLDKETKKQLKRIALEKDTSIQTILEDFILCFIQSKSKETPWKT
jgi:hypothetical protein